jgi:hypothetical protein
VCRLEHLAKKFKHKADIHEAWTSGKEEMLSSQVLLHFFNNQLKASPPFPVFRIRIRKFLGLPDPDLLVRGTDPAPDPSTIKQ